jgi:hypothetical protein
VGSGPELTEPSERADPLAIGAGVTVNGRLEKPGEVDRYRLGVKSGDRVRVRVMAAVLGSWLDSVVSVRDPEGHLLAENDDVAGLPRRNAGPGSTDSQVDLVARADQDLIIEVADRDLGGGPEFGYRLEVGPPRPELRALVAFNHLKSFRSEDKDGRTPAVVLVSREAFTLRHGQYAVMPINVVADSLSGPITIAAEGLPPGLIAPPVVVEPAAMGSANLAGHVEFTTEFLIGWTRDARLVRSGKFRVVAQGESMEGDAVRSVASAVVTFDAIKLAAPSVPVTRRVTEFFVKVIGP